MTDGQDQALKTKDILGLTLPIKLFMYWDMTESYIKELYLKIIRINISLYIKFLL